MHPAELFELQTTEDPMHWRWEPSGLLMTPSRSLHGGAALGAAATALVAAAGRPVVWATAQYLSFAVGTSSVDLRVNVEVAGHNTTQARCVISRDGSEILTAHAALGSRSDDRDGVWCEMPAVPAPEACPEYRFFEHGRGGIGDLFDIRLARGRQVDELDGERGDGIFTLWVRVASGRRMMTVAELALIGDLMPLGFADAVGERFAGNSLDNTIRVGKFVETEWVLVAINIQQIANGFGYGTAELWADDGTLLGAVGQSSVIRLHSRIHARGTEPERSPKHPVPRTFAPYPSPGTGESGSAQRWASL